MLERHVPSLLRPLVVALVWLLSSDTVRAAAPDPSDLLASIGRACSNGEPDACARLGARYLAPQEGEWREVVATARKSCGERDTAGCLYGLAIVHWNGLGIAADKARALPLFETACRMGHGDACYFSGIAALRGDGCAIDKAAAMQSFIRACMAKHAKACTELARGHRIGDGILLSAGDASRLSNDACNLGDPQGCMDLAQAMEAGDTWCSNNSQECLYDLYQRACSGGVTSACASAARLAKSRGEEPSAALAGGLRKACEAGNAEVCDDAKRLAADVGVVRSQAQLLNALFGPTACELPGSFCIKEGLRWQLAPNEGLVPLLKVAAQGEVIPWREKDTQDFYYYAARNDMGLAPFLKSLDEDVKPVLQGLSAYDRPYSVEYTDFKLPQPSSGETLRVVGAFGSAPAPKKLVGLVAETHREAAIDLRYLLEKWRKHLAASLGAQVQIVDEGDRIGLFLETPTELAIVNMSVVVAKGKNHFFLSRSVFSRAAAAKLRQQAMTRGAELFLAERKKVLGLTTPDEVFDYQIATAEKALATDPQAALQYTLPLFFLAVRQKEAVAIRSRALAAIEKTAKAKREADAKRAEEEAAKQIAVRAQAAAKAAARDAERQALWAGVDAAVEVQTAVFDPELALGKTVLWSGVVVRRLASGEYLLAAGGNYWCLSTKERIDGVQIVFAKGKVKNVVEVSDGLLAARVPVVEGSLVSPP